LTRITKQEYSNMTYRLELVTEKSWRESRDEVDYKIAGFDEKTFSAAGVKMEGDGGVQRGDVFLMYMTGKKGLWVGYCEVTCDKPFVSEKIIWTDPDHKCPIRFEVKPKIIVLDPEYGVPMDIFSGTSSKYNKERKPHWGGSLRPSLSKIDEDDAKRIIEALNDTAQKHPQFVKSFPVQRITTTREDYIRDPSVAKAAKERANGFCQLCGNKAPFEDKHGAPYLECHHIKWLSEDGDDELYNTVALCPNCHRKMHILDDEEDRNTLTEKAK